MKPIKTRTYRNFMRVHKIIMEKGYDAETASQITRNIFDQFESCPQGLPILSLVDMIVEAS